MAIRCVDFAVDKGDWRATRLFESELGALRDGQVLLRVDRFAFTSNNVSYALAGDMLDYWGFFPLRDGADGEGWGRIPVMGFGDVVSSAHAEVEEGARVFGFFPMSTHLVIQADRVNDKGFADGSPHRAKHAPAYVQYSRVSHDPLYDAHREDQLALLRGLFMTSFLVDDFLADNDAFGAEAFVLSSASSKTAIALAWLLAKRARGRVIGLTSPRHVLFVEGLGSYDQVLSYGDLDQLASDASTVFVDMAGDGDVSNRIHRHLGESLKYDCTVGATHWNSGPRSDDLPGAAPAFFFAPAQIQKRSQEWGPEALQERLGRAWRKFDAASNAWLRVARAAGPRAVERVYRETLEGRTEPSRGNVLSLHEEAEHS